MKFNYLAPINSSGYGVSGLNILLGLQRRLGEGNIALHPIHDIDIEVSQEQSRLINKALEVACNFDKLATSLRLWFPDNLAERVGCGRAMGMTFFELDTLTKKQYHHIQSLDDIFVPTQWAKGILEKNNISHCHVAPLGVDREIFNEHLSSPRLDENTTVFSFIGKAELRKGVDVLAKAFHKAFGPQDDVLLILACDNPFIGEQDNNYWRNLFLSGSMFRKVIFKRRSSLTNQGHLARLIAETDVGVFPARAEGWNLEALEFLSCGKFLIATDYSGHTEFLTNQNSSLINTPNMEVANDGVFFKGENQGRWASFGQDELDQLIHHMRQAHKKKQEQGPSINLPGIETAKRFSWDNTVHKILEAV